MYGKGQRPLPNRTDSDDSVALATFTGNRAIADVRAVEAAFPVDLRGQLVRLLLRGVHAGTHRGGAQYAATGGYNFAVLERGAGMEDLAFQRSGRVEGIGTAGVTGGVTRLRMQHGPVPGSALDSKDHEKLLRKERGDDRRQGHVPVHPQAIDRVGDGPSDLYENASGFGRALPNPHIPEAV